MRAWGVVAAISLSVVTACGSATATTKAPATRASTTAPDPAAGDPVTTECGTLLSDAAAATARILSYDYHDLPASLAALRAVTTPAEYATESDERMNTVDPLAAQNHAVLTATALATGYVDGGCDRPRVLVFAQITSTNSTDPKGDTSDDPLLLTLTPVGGHYLVDGTGDASGGVGSDSTAPDCPTAAAAATRVAALSASYDYRKLDAQLPAVAADLTGAALVNFQQEEADLRSAVISGKVVATAAVQASAYQGGGCAGPSFLVSMSVTYGRAAASPQPGSELLRITLRPDGGSRWLASDITPYVTGSS